MDVDISVAVTTYRRPEMVRDLILSFLGQSYRKAELVIVDDCVEDRLTERIARDYAEKDPRIRFIKNPENLGYSRNFLKSLLESRGRYILTLGDDDILLHPDALARYVEVFEKHPQVGFIYSNILQFNSRYQMDFVYDHFRENTHFRSLEARLEKIWLKCCYIPGIGLRNNVDFAELYPREDWLFPQVELIGKILGKAEAYGLSEYLIGGRAHESQLGFEAVKGKKIKKNERHAAVELIEIFEKLQRYYREQGIELRLTNSFVKRFFIESHASILPTEKINTGNYHLLRVFFEAVSKNRDILFSRRYLFYMVLSLLLPARALVSLKNTYKSYLVEKKWYAQQRYFQEQQSRIGLKRMSDDEMVQP